MDAAAGQEPNALLRIAAGLYGVGMLVLLSPVISDVPYDGQMSRDGDFSSVCGLTLTSAFVRPSEDDPSGQRKVDCAARASDRVGYGFLVLAVAAPVAVSAFASRRRTQR